MYLHYVMALCELVFLSVFCVLNEVCLFLCDFILIIIFVLLLLFRNAPLTSSLPLLHYAFHLLESNSLEANRKLKIKLPKTLTYFLCTIGE